MDDKEYKELLEHNISVLGTYGIHYAYMVHSAVLTLQKHINGELQITQEDLQKISDIAVRVSEKHIKMLRMSREERANYDDPDNSNKK